MFSRTIDCEQLARAVGRDVEVVYDLLAERGPDAVIGDGVYRQTSLAHAARLIRAHRLPVTDPHRIGLRRRVRFEGEQTEPINPAAFDEHLNDGDAEGLADAMMHAYLCGHELGAIFDGPVRDGITRIGDLWRHGPEGIAIEHLATVALTVAVRAFDLALRLPRAHGPVAVGGAIGGDHSHVPSAMAAAVLGDKGFMTVDLGATVPLDSLAVIVRYRRPSVVWLSINHCTAIEPSAAERDRFAERTLATDAALIVGGRALDDGEIEPPAGSQYLPGMSDLAERTAA